MYIIERLLGTQAGSIQEAKMPLEGVAPKDSDEKSIFVHC